LPSSAARIGSHASRRAQYTLSIGKGFQRLGFVDHADELKINNSSSPSPARLSDDRPIRRSPSSEHSTCDGPVRPIQPGRRRQCNLVQVRPPYQSYHCHSGIGRRRHRQGDRGRDRVKTAPGPVRRVSVHAYSADTDGPVAHVTHTHGTRVQLARRPRSRPGRRWAVPGLFCPGRRGARGAGGSRRQLLETAVPPQCRQAFIHVFVVRVEPASSPVGGGHRHRRLSVGERRRSTKSQRPWRRARGTPFGSVTGCQC
jgi:hypothetical protein